MATPSGGGLKRAAERGRRRSGFRAFAFLGLAALAAVGTAVVLTRYLEVRTAAARIPTARVVVAAMDIPLATALRPEALRTIDWPAASRPESAVADPGPLVGRVAMSPIVKGEPILEQKLASTAAGSGLAALLPEGMRAVAVRVDDVVGVAGFVHPGDHVDVIATLRPVETSGEPPVSKIVLQGIRVLAVGKDVTRPGGSVEKAVTATVVTLMVNSEQAEKLALSATKGQILLALRSRVDLAEVETRGITPPALLRGGEARPAVVAAAPPPRPAPRPAASRKAPAKATPIEPAPERQTVEVIRGDLFEKRDFKKDARP